MTRPGLDPCSLDSDGLSVGNQVLCIADWSQTLSFYNLAGKQVGKERNLGFDPCCVAYSYFSKGGPYILVAGANKACVVYTKDGVKLGVVGGDQQVWSLTQFHSIDFSQSRISVKKCSFNKTHNQGLDQLILTVSWDLCA